MKGKLNLHLLAEPQQVPKLIFSVNTTVHVVFIWYNSLEGSKVMTDSSHYKF